MSRRAYDRNDPSQSGFHSRQCCAHRKLCLIVGRSRKRSPHRPVRRRVGFGAGIESSGCGSLSTSPQVHLEEGPTGRRLFFQMLTHLFPGRSIGRVAVHADPLAHLAAEHLPDRHVPGFARQIPAGDFDCGNATAGTTKPSELLDLAEDLRNVARVHADEAALQHQPACFAGIIADLAISGNALVRIEAHEHGSLGMCDTHVGDSQG